ncbi:MAG TPA: hypothetical protein VNV15_08175 [Opitutaceae bacterium]|nr:hypothetical protein [Opitutaceae bacterium]
MTKAERLLFLRKRFGRPKGLFVAKQRPPEPKKQSYRFDAFGVPQHLTELRQKQIYVPDKKPPLRLDHKRKGCISPLHLIAKKWRPRPVPRPPTTEA